MNHVAASPAVCQTDQLADLPRIFADEIQLCLYRRPPVAEVVEYLGRARPGLGFRLVAEPGRQPDLPGLEPLPEREALLRDIALLTDIYAVLLGCPQVGIRLEVLNGAMCPRFHVDRVGLRLLCCYRGPGTEWLAPQAADYSKLGHGANGLSDACSGLILDDDAIGRAPPFSLLLLKGTQWPGNAGRGAIHRSPAMACGQPPRVLLALDAVW